MTMKIALIALYVWAGIGTGLITSRMYRNDESHRVSGPILWGIFWPFFFRFCLLVLPPHLGMGSAIDTKLFVNNTHKGAVKMSKTLVERLRTEPPVYGSYSTTQRLREEAAARIELLESTIERYLADDFSCNGGAQQMFEAVLTPR